ncbi:MAG: UDP-N-acetylmuramate dehydrogenase [Candidatus Doudnabacteria bacterium]
MDIKENYSLAPLTTFRIGGLARYFISVRNLEELKEALRMAKRNKLGIFILGGGSNLLISDKGFQGLVIAMNIKGIEVKEAGETAELRAGSSEIWDEVVMLAISRNLWGIENLSNIPGFVGAIPVQNVGAYGQEASQVVENVEALDLASLELKNFSNQDCAFAYRQSRFNTVWKNKYAILSVTFKLSKQPKPNLDYADVKKYFENTPDPGQPQIRQAIIEIRKSKFPDLAAVGTAGSFFKNIILNKEQFDTTLERIKENFGSETADKLITAVNKFPQADGIKVPAAFLIDICGLKGRSAGDARLWERQPLVIVNLGQAKAADVMKLFELVKAEVLAKTGIELAPEPEFIGF